MSLRTASRHVQHQEQPPDDNHTEHVASLERPDGSELRVDLAEYKGHPFVRVQLFKPDHREPEVLRPTPRLVTVKLHELEEFRDAIEAVIERVKGPGVDDLPANVGARR